MALGAVDAPLFALESSRQSPLGGARFGTYTSDGALGLAERPLGASVAGLSGVVASLKLVIATTASRAVR